MSSINFVNPYLLLIAIPLLALFIVPFVLAVRKDNRNGHNVASLVLHCVLAVLIAFVAAGTNIVTILSETDVYVVADVSYSANRNLDTVDSYIKNLKLPQNAKLGVVCFGKDQQLLYALGKPDEFTTVKDADVDDSETNIAEALEYTGTLFGENVIKNVVLITDGKQTDARDTYAIRRAVGELRARNINVDAIYLDDNIDENAKEVQISSVNFTADTYLNHEESAVVNVQSSYETQAFVTLYSGEEELRTRPVTLTEGVNSINFDLDTSVAGTFDYEIKITADGDENQFNNRYTFSQTVDGNIRVLFITESWDNCVKAAEQYGSATEIDIYENDLREQDANGVSMYRAKNNYISQCPSNVHIHTNSRDVPFTVEDLCKYDEIVLADVDPTTLKNDTLFMESLDTVVSKFGKSLVTFGDLAIQNKEDKELKQLEDMLPVRFGNDDTAPKLFTLVIDSSRSMEQNYHMINAKLAANSLIDILNEGDNICVVTFNGDMRVLQPAKAKADGVSVKNIINSIENAQGTFIGKGLQAAYDQIRDLPFSEKQVMLITDGLSYTDEEDNPVRIAQNMYADGIITSVIDMARQGEDPNGVSADPVAAAAKQTLQDVANSGHGNYFYWSNSIQSAGTVPDLLFAQFKKDSNETVVDGKRTTVNVARRVDDVLVDMDRTAIPDVMGYVYSYNKASATTVLTVNHEKTTGITKQPLYSYWAYGTGKVSTFTSSFSGEWVEEWEKSEYGGVFLDNVVKVNIPNEKSDYPYNFNLIRNGNFVKIEVTPAAIRLTAKATAEITFPDGQVISSDLIFNSNKYYYEFSADSTGKYKINVIYSYNNLSYPSTTLFDISYGSEYDSFAVFEPSTLHNAIDEEGVVGISEPIEIRNDERQLGTYVINLTMPLLIASAALYVVDIVIRKLKWEDIKSFFGFNKKEAKKR